MLTLTCPAAQAFGAAFRTLNSPSSHEKAGASWLSLATIVARRSGGQDTQPHPLIGRAAGDPVCPSKKASSSSSSAACSGPQLHLIFHRFSNHNQINFRTMSVEDMTEQVIGDSGRAAPKAPSLPAGAWRVRASAHGLSALAASPAFAPLKLLCERRHWHANQLRDPRHQEAARRLVRDLCQPRHELAPAPASGTPSACVVLIRSRTA